MPAIKTSLETIFPKIDSFSRRREIDGLRGIAVLLVLLNHIDNSFAPSGYIGVDIFFVISGYVVTRSLASKNITDLKEFFSVYFARRVKRIYPALTVYVLATSILISFFNQHSSSALLTASRGLLGLANIALYRGSWDYFSQQAHLNPFTQLWSLSVEEQFYLFFPLAVGFCIILARLLGFKTSFYKLIATISFVSFISFAWNSINNVSAAYYLTPNRFWELGLGILIYRAESLSWRFNHRLETLLQAVFLPLLIALSALPKSILFFTISSTAILTAAFLLASTKNHSFSLSKTILLLQPSLYIGKISYSLYLWHWGVIVLSRWTIGIHMWSIPIIIFFSFLAGHLSYELVESNNSFILRRIKPLYVYVLVPFCISIILNIVSVFDLSKNVFLGRQKSDLSDATRLRDESNSISKENIYWLKSALDRVNSSHTSPLNPQISNQKILFIGDSHTEHLFPLANNLTKNLDISTALIYAHGARFPTVNWSHPTMITKQQIKDRNASLNTSFNKALNDLQANDIVVLSSSVHYLFKDSDPWQSTSYWNEKFSSKISQRSAAEDWIRKVNNLSRKLKRKNIALLVFLPLPFFGYSNESPTIEQCTPEWFNSTNFALRSDCPQLLKPVQKEYLLELYKPFMIELNDLQSQNPNLHLFDPLPILCPGTFCTTTTNDNKLLYIDDDHLSTLGATLLASPFNSFLKYKKLIPSKASFISHRED